MNLLITKLGYAVYIDQTLKDSVLSIGVYNKEYDGKKENKVWGFAWYLKYNI